MKNHFLIKNTVYLVILFLTVMFSGFIIKKSNLSNINFNNVNEVLFLFFPLEYSKEFLYTTIENTFITLSIATISIFISTLISLPMSVFCSSNLSSSTIFKNKNKIKDLSRYFLRTNFLFFRSLPEIIVALLLVRILGLGVNAAILSIVITFTGFMTKVFIEIIDSSNSISSENLIRSGAGKFKVFFYTTLPICSKEIISYIVFRWECAIRTSLILGIVGAGGLGQQMELAIKMMDLNEVSTIVFVLIFLVYICDQISNFIRKVFV